MDKSLSSTSASSMAVLGAGSWGTALAIHFAKQDVPTVLWAHRASHVKSMAVDRCNKRFLEEVPFPKLLTVSDDIASICKANRDLCIVVPSIAFVDVLTLIKPHINNKWHRIYWATKGFDKQSGRWFIDILNDEFGVDMPKGLISGPTFAKEVALGLPCAITVSADACNQNLIDDFVSRFHTPYFRVYYNHDMLGTELGGALKNVLALACGMIDGLGLGSNAQAAFITRGFSELLRLGKAVGTQEKTLLGLTGLGDLILTCTDNKSRNRRFGLYLGQGDDFETAKQKVGQVVEGVETVYSIQRLAKDYNLECPIVAGIHSVITEEHSVAEAMQLLLMRRPKEEF